MFDDIISELKLVLLELIVRLKGFWTTSKRQIVFFSAIVLVFVISLFLLFGHLFKGTTGGDIRINVHVAKLTRDELRGLKRYLNPYHVAIGRSKGIANPFLSKQSFEDNKWLNVATNDLEEVEGCDNYGVMSSTYSVPYLKSDAKAFLDEVGALFAKRLEELHIGHYRFKVNSLLRTLQDQKNLQGSNPNAAKTTSSHLYGRSFDIAESKFFDGDSKEPKYSVELRIILLRELLELQQQGRCYVILENVTNCIHVTVR